MALQVSIETEDQPKILKSYLISSLAIGLAYLTFFIYTESWINLMSQAVFLLSSGPVLPFLPP